MTKKEVKSALDEMAEAKRTLVLKVQQDMAIRIQDMLEENGFQLIVEHLIKVVPKK